jgi:hypothetical protein
MPTIDAGNLVRKIPNKPCKSLIHFRAPKRVTNFKTWRARARIHIKLCKPFRLALWRRKACKMIWETYESVPAPIIKHKPWIRSIATQIKPKQGHRSRKLQAVRIRILLKRVVQAMSYIIHILSITTFQISIQFKMELWQRIWNMVTSKAIQQGQAPKSTRQSTIEILERTWNL